MKTAEEYRQKMNDINIRVSREQKEVGRQYAFSNNPHSIGDVVTDHIGSIKVEEIKWTIDHGTLLPTCVYYGVVLKKDGTPTKKGDRRPVWQSNLILEKEYDRQ
jgi:hypothetical protein